MMLTVILTMVAIAILCTTVNSNSIERKDADKFERKLK